MSYSLCINGKEPIVSRKHIHEVKNHINICINSVLENLGYNVTMNNLTKTLTAEKGEKRVVVKKEKTIIHDNEKSNEIKLDTEYYNKAMYINYRDISKLVPCCCFEMFEKNIIYVITSHEEMYRSYIEFVKEKDKYENGIYTVSSSANSVITTGDISFCYVEENDTLRVVYNKHYISTTTTIIDIFGIYSTYKWTYKAAHEIYPNYAEGEFRPIEDGSIRKDIEFLDIRINDFDDRHFFKRTVCREIFFLKTDLDWFFKRYHSPLSSQYLMC